MWWVCHVCCLAAQAAALVWDEKLVASAKKWADTCTFGVSRTAGVGEALGFGYRTFPDAVNGWYNQVGAGEARF